MQTRKWLNAPCYVASFLSLFLGLQVRALLLQFDRGFRPFEKDPLRVPLSWDMFATRTERCLMQWDPPLEFDPIGVLKEINDLSKFIEWDVIYDSKDQYRNAGQLGCILAHRSQFTRVHLHCFTLEGKEVDDDFNCGSVPFVGTGANSCSRFSAIPSPFCRDLAHL